MGMVIATLNIVGRAQGRAVPRQCRQKNVPQSNGLRTTHRNKTTTLQSLLANTLNQRRCRPCRALRVLFFAMTFPFQFLLQTILPQLLMGKDKKQRSKKDKASNDMLEVAAQSLKKFRKVTKEIAKLSTGQKLVGGLAIAAAGLAYLATRETDDAPAGFNAKVLPDEAEAPVAFKRQRKASKHHSEE